jgi:ribosome maturation factor RimP
MTSLPSAAMTFASASLPIEEAAREAVHAICAGHNVEVYDIVLHHQSGGLVFQVLVERKGSASARLSTKDAAVDLGTCTQIARELSPALDASPPTTARYNLEVSSPGIERTLRHEADYQRFVGEKVKLKVRGASAVVGKLTRVDASSVAIETSAANAKVAEEKIIAFSTIESGRLVFEFGATPKNVRNSPNRDKKKGK